MRIDPHPCYILHLRPYRETSLLVELLSALHGRTGIIARGAKRKSGNMTALLQPFRRLSIAWTGRGELGVLVSAEADGRHQTLQAGSVLAGFYLNELVMRLLHRHDAHPELFSAYESALQGLMAGDADESVLRVFEVKLLQAIGYGLVLDRDTVTGEPVTGEQIYRFQTEKGPVATDAADTHGVFVHGRTLLALAHGRLEDVQSLREAKALLRTEIARHLNGRPLASRNLYQAYLNNIRGGRVDRDKQSG